MEINIKTKNRTINNTSPTYIIAEIGINHNGRYDLAEKLIIESAKAGVDAVKFQKRDAKSIMIEKNINSNPKGYLSKNENDISIDQPEYGSWSYPDTRLELSEEDYIKLKDVAENLNVDFFASPWDQKSLEFLIKIGISIVKIPSVEITNYDYLEKFSKIDIPIILSTGTANEEEVDKALNLLSKNNNKTPANPRIIPNDLKNVIFSSLVNIWAKIDPVNGVVLISIAAK